MTGGINTDFTSSHTHTHKLENRVCAWVGAHPCTEPVTLQHLRRDLPHFASAVTFRVAHKARPTFLPHIHDTDRQQKDAANHAHLDNFFSKQGDDTKSRNGSEKERRVKMITEGTSQPQGIGGVRQWKVRTHTRTHVSSRLSASTSLSLSSPTSQIATQVKMCEAHSGV